MLWRRTFTVLLALAMLALPASSFAQSAGDDQYQDPLGGQGGGSNPHSSSGGSSGGSSGSSSPSTTPAASTPSTPSTAGTSGTGTTPTASGAKAGTPGELPRTGFDVIVTIELGIAMLLSGLVAQRLLILRDRRQGSHQRL
jgi:pectate lyase